MPVWREVLADLHTPVGVYDRLRGAGGPSFLLESVERGRLGRHSFVGFGSRLVGIEEVEALGAPVVGYLAYDHVAKLEPTVPLPRDGRGLPESRFLIADALVRFDHVTGIANVLHGDRNAIVAALDAALPETNEASTRYRTGPVRRSPDQATYEAGVRACQEHIRRGDAFQIVLSQRAERATTASALDLYRALRRVNPSPYLFLLELDGLALVGSSPETLVKSDGSVASLNPIAGTTTPGEGDAERLLSSEKDRAENLMIVDLLRNDLGRVASVGSVEVKSLYDVERYRTVHQLTSTIEARLPVMGPVS